MAATEKKRGRPSSFRPEFEEQARKLSMLGLTDERVALFFGVSIVELAEWAFDSESFYNAITPTDSERYAWGADMRARAENRRNAKRARMKASPHERIANSVRARMWAALKGKSSGGCFARLGYGLQELKEHLEGKFLPGMTWKNYGKWHIDHIRPCASFDLAEDVQFSECWALENLQPLWAADNIRKGATYGGS